jgi:hypothetical protein
LQRYVWLRFPDNHDAWVKNPTSVIALAPPPDGPYTCPHEDCLTNKQFFVKWDRQRALYLEGPSRPAKGLLGYEGWPYAILRVPAEPPLVLYERAFGRFDVGLTHIRMDSALCMAPKGPLPPNLMKVQGDSYFDGLEFIDQHPGISIKKLAAMKEIAAREGQRPSFSQD